VPRPTDWSRRHPGMAAKGVESSLSALRASTTSTVLAALARSHAPGIRKTPERWRTRVGGHVRQWVLSNYDAALSQCESSFRHSFPLEGVQPPYQCFGRTLKLDAAVLREQ